MFAPVSLPCRAVRLLHELRRCVGRTIVAARSMASSHSPSWAGLLGMV
jgi:hypothetical protein